MSWVSCRGILIIGRSLSTREQKQRKCPETGFVSYGEKTGSGFQKLFSWAYVGGCGSDGQSCLHAPINTNHNVYFADLDIKEVETELAKGDVCAVILEGISGVGGIQVPDEDFLRQLRN